jgi:hypothetical protein
MTSPDGATWTARAAAEANQWMDVTYGNGLFVAVARTGTNPVMTSPDGINWTARAAAEANQWYGVTYGNGLFVAVSTGGTNRVMTSDATPPGFTLSTSTATVSETGTTATFTVVLNAQPGSDVVFSVVSADTGEATVDKAALTFTNANWNSPQTVTVTGIDDDAVDGNQATTITVAVVDASSDDSYDALADQTVTVTTTHNDVPPPPPGVRDFCNTTGTIWGHPFSDLTNPDTAFLRDIGCLYNSGVVRGTKATTFSPDHRLNREQAAALIQRAMSVALIWCTGDRAAPSFSDLASTSFAYGEILCLYRSGLSNGTTATTFSPSAPVTRADTAALVARLYRFLPTKTCPTAPPPFTDTTGNWASDDIACVYGLGIDTGTTTTTFSPDDTLTRSDMVTILARTLRALLW